MIEKLFLVAAALGLLGAVLVVLSWLGRRGRGLGSGKTIALDNVTLYSEAYDLVGRPDRIVRTGGHLIPEEWKSSRRVNHGHKVQLGVYFILIKESYGKIPPYGVVVLGDGSRHEVENTEELRSEVLEYAEQIRAARRSLAQEIPVRQPAAKCTRCGQRANCGQARG